ncbi:MetI-like domain [Moorella glycerini]|uniref:Inner membrane ABC transporter permease protein YdcU n=2 Tax=Neomoorella stamsii TaxID=1266720 RepID=A0A9X7J305_9FIRM|nr:Inner membrane ABC transporter permease protein YdcU [Moorella stamsii]CEP66891.1 MetI-like domain [Moorella glycerini]CEP67226.1 MetI-like domain [Moorella glycerini]
MMRLATKEKPVTLAVVGAVLALTTAYPLIRLLLAGFFTPIEGFTLAPLLQVVFQKATWTVLYNTVVVSLAATAISSILGITLAWLVVKSDLPCKSVINIATLLFLFLPPYVHGLAWLQLWGPVGWFNQLASFIAGKKIVLWNVYGLDGTILLLGLLHYPFVYMTTATALGNIPPEEEEVAFTYGVSRSRVVRRVTLPLALPGIAAGSILAFVSSVGNFGIPALVALPAGKILLTTYIFQQVVGFSSISFARVSLLATLGAMLAITGMMVQNLFLKHQHFTVLTKKTAPLYYSLGRVRIPLAVFLYSFLACATIAPLIAMFLNSLLPAYGVPLTLETITLKNYRFILADLNATRRAIATSFILAGGTTLITIPLSFVVARGIAEKRSKFYLWVDRLGTIPYTLPGTVLALAVILAWVDPWIPIPIYGSIVMILLAYIARFFTLAARNLTAGFAQLNPSYTEVARVLGIRPWQCLWKISLPLLRPNIQNAALLVFITALTELTVSSLLWISGSETIGVTIYNLEAAGYTTYSTAFATLVVLFFGVFFLLLKRTRLQTFLPGR